MYRTFDVEQTDFEKICDANNLIQSYRLTSKESKWKESVQRYGINLLQNVRKTQLALQAENYEQKPFKEFVQRERGKERNIRAMHISDRVVQRVVCDYVLIPKLTPYLIYDNGASLKNKGVDFTRDRLITHLEKYYRKYGNEGYILQIDFKGYFDSIPHPQLLEAISKHVTDEKALRLITQMIESFGEQSVGIGSQISQICGVYYATPIDNYCKIVRRCKYYARYNDDIYVIHPSKEYLRELLAEITKIADSLGLVIHPKKTHIVKLSHGFTFMQIKYNLLEDGRILKRINRPKVVRERRKLKKYQGKLRDGIMQYKDIENAYQSWKGNAKKYDCEITLKHMNKLYDDLFIIPWINGEEDWFKDNKTSVKRKKGKGGRYKPQKAVNDSKNETEQ